MNSIALKLILRDFKILKWHRKLCCSAVRRIEFVVKSSIPDVIVPQMRFLDRLWVDSGSFRNHVALESAETKKTYTYAQLQKYMAVFATSLLKKLGLKPGETIAVIAPNCPEFPVVAFGGLQAGVIVTTITVNPIHKELEIIHHLTITEPKLIVTIPECYDTVAKTLKSMKMNIKVVIIDNASNPVPNDVIRYSEIAETGSADYALLDKIEKKLDDVAFITFSSGTTGMAKGVEITYGNLLASLEIMHQKETCYTILTHGNVQDILPAFLPFFHIYGLVITLVGHLSHGCKMITMAQFSASTFLETLKNVPLSLLYIVPPVATLLAKHPDVNEKHLHNVRTICCGAAPLAVSDVESVVLKSKHSIEFNQGFGATETTSITTSTFIGTKNVDYSACGVPLPNVKIRFADPITGEPVPIGQEGEIYIKSPTVMKGYHKNPTATKEAMTSDGYYKSGDLGYFKPGVGLFITERKKDLIKVNGMQVAPTELEIILRSHPAVQDAAVIGIPHEFYGEALKAFIIRENGDKTSAKEIQDYVANKVAVYKKIEQVVFVDKIPKTGAGKVLRRELKKYA